MQFTVHELRSELRELGLRVSGIKEDLVRRVVETVRSTHGQATTIADVWRRPGSRRRPLELADLRTKATAASWISRTTAAAAL